MDKEIEKNDEMAQEGFDEGFDAAKLCFLNKSNVNEERCKQMKAERDAMQDELEELRKRLRDGVPHRHNSHTTCNVGAFDQLICPI